MPSITFKLLGAIGENSERQILIDSELSIGEIKVLVRTEFKLVPNAKVTFLHMGKRYGSEEDHLAFKRLPIDPRKEKVTVIVSNPYASY